MAEYRTVEEVKGVCKGLKIGDWKKLNKRKVLPREGKTILAAKS